MKIPFYAYIKGNILYFLQWSFIELFGGWLKEVTVKQSCKQQLTMSILGETRDKREIYKWCPLLSNACKEHVLNFCFLLADQVITLFHTIIWANNKALCKIVPCHDLQGSSLYDLHHCKSYKNHNMERNLVLRIKVNVNLLS